MSQIALILSILLIYTTLSLANSIPTHSDPFELISSTLQHAAPYGDANEILIRRQWNDETSAGFHRTLRTEISVFGSAPEDWLSSCRLMLRESLPSAFYFDLYQLRDLFRFQSMSQEPRQGVVEVHTQSDIELERPAELSQEYQVWFDIQQPKWEKVEGGKDGNQHYLTVFEVPIHARYQAASYNDTHRIATLPPPTVYVNCDSNASTSMGFPITSWYRFSSIVTPASLQFSVPVGNLHHLPLVRFGTLILTMVTALILSVLACCQSRGRVHFRQQDIKERRE